MTDVSLTTPTRQTLFQIQRSADLRQQATLRIASGQRVNRASDDAAAFYRARGLSNRVADLLQTRNAIGQALNAVETAQIGVAAISDLANQLKGLALSVRGADAASRQAAAEQFDILRAQLGALATDAGFGGVSLLADDQISLAVPLNETGTATATVHGAASDAASLGIGTATAGHNNFAGDADIAAAVSQLDGALSMLRTRAAGLGGGISLLNTRADFNGDLGNTLQSGVDKLVNADLNEESARQLSLRLREKLGVFDLGLATRNATLVSDLIAG